MKQTARIISIYTADVSGVCSALFELGGMTVMHDASGCNTTYNTHDEPRWYDHDSLVFISALSEMEAIMGDDEKLVRDVSEAAERLHPNFIALAGTPVPLLTGVDFPALAALVEQRTGIVTFGLPTNEMHSYLTGASMAFAALAERLVTAPAQTRRGSVNILGVTPLDFSVNGADRSLRAALEGGGFSVQSVWAMGSSLEAVQSAGQGEVNLVASFCGLEAARILQRRFGTPYVVGLPMGPKGTETLISDLRGAAADGKSRVSFENRASDGAKTFVIGESVGAGSLAAALTDECGIPVRLLCPLETEPELLCPGDKVAEDEDDLIPLLAGADTVIADPLYRPICPTGARFVPLPHEAFSGRIYRKELPDLIGNFDAFCKRLTEGAT